jgi:hypothetical protein
LTTGYNGAEKRAGLSGQVRSDGFLRNEKVILTTGYFPDSGSTFTITAWFGMRSSLILAGEKRLFEIRVLDLQTGKPMAGTRRTRYFSPALLPEDNCWQWLRPIREQPLHHPAGCIFR